MLAFSLSRANVSLDWTSLRFGFSEENKGRELLALWRMFIRSVAAIYLMQASMPARGRA